jgi:hypothetical protein
MSAEYITAEGIAELRRRIASNQHPCPVSLPRS